MKKIIMILMALGLMTASSMAAIVQQGSALTASQVITGVDDETLTLGSFGNASGNYVVVVASAKDKTAGGDVNAIQGVTYGGVAMTLLNSANIDNGGYGSSVAIYGLATTAASGDVVMTYNAGGLSPALYDGASLAAASFSGVGGVGPVSDTDARRSSGDLQDSITATEGGLLLVGMSIGDGTAAEGNVTSGFSMLAEVDGSGAQRAYVGMFSQDITAGDFDYIGDFNSGAADRASIAGVQLLVPEPATVGMLGLGAVVALLARRIRA